MKKHTIARKTNVSLFFLSLFFSVLEGRLVSFSKIAKNYFSEMRAQLEFTKRTEMRLSYVLILTASNYIVPIFGNCKKHYSFERSLKKINASRLYTSFGYLSDSQLARTQSRYTIKANLTANRFGNNSSEPDLLTRPLGKISIFGETSSL